MKNLIILFLLIFVIGCLSNCSNNSVKTPSVSINLDKAQESRDLLNKDLLEEEVIKIVGQDSLLPGSCMKLLLTSNKYIILDELKQRVWFINHDGFITSWIDYSSIHNNGITDIIDICLVGSDTVALFDIGLKKIYLYNEEGKYIEEYNVPFRYGNFVNLTKDVYFFSVGRSIERSSDLPFCQFFVYNVRESKIIKSFLPYSTPFNNWISHRRDIDINSNRLVCITSFDNTIYALKDTLFSPLISFDFGISNIDTSGISKKDRIEKMDIDGNIIWSLGEIFLDNTNLYLWTIRSKIGYLTRIDMKNFNYQVVRGLNVQLFTETDNYLVPKPLIIRNGIAYAIVFFDSVNSNMNSHNSKDSINSTTWRVPNVNHTMNPVIIKYKIRN